MMQRPFRRFLVLMCAGAIGAGCSSTPSKPHVVTPQQRTSTSTSTTVSSGTTPATTTTAAGTPACTTVVASAGQTDGAAGTITGSITLADPGSTPCDMTGYPSMALFSAAGTTLSVTIIDGLTVDISTAANAPPALVTLTSSQSAAFTYQYSDVPTGSETSCPSSVTISVTPPGSNDGSTPIPLSMDPCDNGTIRVSPVYAANG